MSVPPEHRTNPALALWAFVGVVLVPLVVGGVLGWWIGHRW